MESILEDDDRLVLMVQDFIESSSPSSPTSSCAAANHGSFFSSSPSDDDRHSMYLACFLRDILKEKETEAEADVLGSVMKLMRRRMMRRKKGSSNSSTSRNCSTGLKKWLVLGLQMEGYLASLCQTSWVTSLGCPGGDYEYIDIVILEDDDQREHLHHRLIVDIDFKSQFEVARPTPTYKELTDILPAVFVGSESKLNRIISILCSGAEQSLRERGLHIPPWRTATYMQSKWLSTTTATKSHFINRPPPPSSSSSSDRNNNNNEDKNDDDDQKMVNSSKVLWAPPPAPTPVSNGTVGVKGKRRSLPGGSALCRLGSPT